MKKAFVFATAAMCFLACDQPGAADGDAGLPIDTDTATGTGSDIDTDTDTDTDTAVPDGVISDVAVTVHPKVTTILVVTWKQNEATDNVWLKFTFENGEYLESPHSPGAVGSHREVILGAPAETEVTFHVVNENGGNAVDSAAYTGTTGALPANMPLPTLIEYDPSIASADRWNLGSVENTQGVTASNPEAYYESAYWIYILDRQARIVWYYKDPLDARILFPKVSADGTHIIYDVTTFDWENQVSLIRRTTLDFEYQEEIDMQNMSWGYAEEPDGKIIYNTIDYGGGGGGGGWTMPLTLYERQTDGTIRQIWESGTWAAGIGVEEQCYSNTINWDPVRDTVLLSMPYLNTVVEIERESGTVAGQWGDAPESWTFDPTTAGLEFNHYATITKDGTFMVSSHIPGGDQPGDHRIMEFEIDDENKILKEKWVYGEGIQDWAMYSGEAQRMENGNTLINYGTGGSVREVTPDKRTAWHILWDADFDSDNVYNKLCGHNVFINDLYALNRGSEK